MTRKAHSYATVLGISPCRRGVGFSVLEVRGRLILWGVARVYSKNEDEALVRVDALIKRYRPIFIALEDCTSTRRGERTLRLIDRLVGNARLLEIEPVLLTKSHLRAVIGLDEKATKHAVATKMASIFPDLEAYLPPKRRPRDSESDRISLFEATALALAARLLKLGD